MIDGVITYEARKYCSALVTSQGPIVKFTELFMPQPRQNPQTRPVHLAEPESICEPPCFAKDERIIFSKLKVKNKLPLATHYRLPLAPDNGIGLIPYSDNFQPLKIRTDYLPVEICQWEEDILFDQPGPRKLGKSNPLMIPNIDWRDDAVVLDDTKPVCYPITKVVIDQQIPDLYLVPRKHSKIAAQPRQNCDSLLEPRPAQIIPIRKHPITPVVSHSPLAVHLAPWQMSEDDSRHFHRPKHPFDIGQKHSVEILRNSELQRQLLMLKHQEDLSATDNLVILLEYSEQHPPIVQNVGMASKLRNYYFQKSTLDQAFDLPDGLIGENVSLEPNAVSPFLGRFVPGERMYGIENHLFRATLFEYKPQITDFLLVQTISGHWKLREIPYLFIVGQTLPLMKVPSPSSKTSDTYSRNRLKRYIYQVLRVRSRIMLSEVKAVFPNETEAAIRSVLGVCCVFNRKGQHGQCWVLKPDFDLPRELSQRATKAEDICLNESSQAALVRLKDAGIRRFTNPYALTEALDALETPESKRALAAIEQEVQLMPWNVSSTFCDVMSGRLRPSITNTESDANDQFAFAKTRTDSRVWKDSRDSEKAGRLADGSDLRKVNIAEARRFLLNHGSTKEKLARIKRWKIVDLMRIRATDLAEAGSTDEEVLKYARPTIANSNVRQQEFDTRAQRIFDRMVSFCTGTDEDPDMDLFERELEALMDEAAIAEKEKEPDGKRKKPGPLKASKRLKLNTPEEDEQGERQALEDILSSRRMNLDPGVTVGQISKSTASPIAGGEIVMKISTRYNDDGSVVKRTEFIRDPGQVAFLLRKKRNLEQKRSNIDTLDDASLPQDDQFFQEIFDFCTHSIEELRSEFGIAKPKDVHLGNLDSSDDVNQRAWLSSSLFVSVPKLELNSVAMDMPSVRCGKHSPGYRSYTWRKYHWTKLEGDVIMLMQQLRPTLIPWCCQHRERPGAPVCGAQYVNLESCVKNKKFLAELSALAKDVSEKLECGYFVPRAYRDKIFVC